MEVTLAKSAGFCYGVRRAVELAEQTARACAPSVMLGPVIHNAHVVEHLEALGMTCLHGTEDIPSGVRVVIRSHGEAKAVYDKIRSAGAEPLDATCPNVSRIHRLVAAAGEAGRIPIVAGTRTHPEVTAIAGWSEHSVIVESAEELEKWLLESPDRRNMPITLVSQTTSTQIFWESCKKIAKKLCTNAEIFDTICYATYERQTEAQRLAATCDAIIVIGDKKSSNTRHLAELCRESCNLVLWIESASELDLKLLRQVQSVGITAGASTPGWIIKEVQNKMSEEIMEIEKSFEEMLEESIKTLNTGDKVMGTVVAITPTEIQVELGTKHTGIIPTTELTDDPSVKAEDIIKIGDQIETFVMRVNDQDGIATLSKKRLDSAKNWEDIESARENRTVIEAKITETNKGGVVANLRGIRIFVPASQTGLPKNGDMESLVHTMVRLRITEVNRSRRRVVGSIRAVAAEERAAKSAAIWADIEPGKKYAGVVKSLTSYGAFVDIGGVDGMVHISALSWSRIKHPSEAVAVGDNVEVYVISADPEKKKISLGMKNPNENPWEVFTGKYQIGDVANVRIVKLMSFGAFAEIVPGVDGLIHISQIADHRIEKPGDELTEGDRVDVKITDIDGEKKKVSLSIRALLQG